MEFNEAVKLHKDLCSLLNKTEKIRETTNHGPVKDMLKNTTSTLHEALFQLSQSKVN